MAPSYSQTTRPVAKSTVSTGQEIAGTGDRCPLSCQLQSKGKIGLLVGGRGIAAGWRPDLVLQMPREKYQPLLVDVCPRWRAAPLSDCPLEGSSCSTLAVQLVSSSGQVPVSQ